MTQTRPTVLVAGNGMVGFRFCRELVARAGDRFRLVSSNFDYRTRANRYG